MKKLVPIAKRALTFLSIVAFISLIGSCEQEEIKTFWNDDAGPTLTDISPNIAKETKEVTITAKYFSATADNSVSFNGIEATITEANISRIVAIVPLGATSGDLTVTSDGIPSVNSLAFTVIETIIPTITSIDPAEAQAGQTVVITGTGFSTTPDENFVSFNGAIALVTESTSTTITVTVPELATTGNVTVTVDDEISIGVMFTSLEPPIITLTIPIFEGDDDAEEWRGAFDGDPDGYMDLGSSDLELCTEAENNMHMVGLIFRDVQIPVGATIKSAYIQFNADDDDSQEGPLPINIWGMNEANTSAPFLEDLFNITSRPNTTAKVTWNAPIWYVKNERGPDQATSDLSAIVQEIIALTGWASGNNMGFKLTNDETLKIHREAEAWDEYDGEGIGMPTLVVLFTEPI